MNVVKLVANTVRRPSLFRTVEAVSPLLADPEREPFQYEIQQQALHYLIPGVQSTTEEKIQAVAKIGHMCWTGGKPAAEFATKNYLVQLANILSVKDPSYSALKLQVVRSLSEMCGASSLTQDLARIQSVVELVVEFMSQGEDEHVRWCLHTLFYLLCNNEANQSKALSIPAFEAGIVRGLRLEWDGWTHNEARELVYLCHLRHLHQYL